MTEMHFLGAQWLSGRVLDSRPKGRGFEPHRIVCTISFHYIDAFNTTSRYLDNILNINNVYFDNMVSQIYPSELKLNKVNTSDTEAAFLDLHFSVSNDIVPTKIYDNLTTLILKLSITHFKMVMFLVLHPMKSISLNSFVLLEHLAMLLNSHYSVKRIDIMEGDCTHNPENIVLKETRSIHDSMNRPNIEFIVYINIVL